MFDALAPLGPLEAELLDQVWAHDAVTARDLYDTQLPTGARAYTTLMTTLDRLYKKGLLTRAKDGMAWRYAAACTRQELDQRRVDALAARIVAQHGDAGLAAFVDAAAAADGPLLDRLDELIRARRAR